MSTTTTTPAADDHPHDEPGKAREAFRSITRDVAWIAEAPKPHKAWLAALAISLIMLGIGVWSIYVVVTRGIGVWGNSNTVGWAWDITNFVWWIGIGHAGTLISAVLYLTRQTWRVSINRAAEAMTIFAVMAAGLFPLLHTGRPWFAWWMLPHPNDMGMWPQFRSPLMWDVFAVSTYMTTSILFWYMGMVPDLATFRDRNAAQGNKLKAVIYGIFSLGWRGSARNWHRYERAYLILAGLATPLVFSVHSVVSFDFATSQLPGWHTTIFPPYFVAG
ncbi:MAG: Polysulfide reductase NrfD, partial [Deltaproteobacteria bacterium]|nr:Polysulfide reductase NrfD [Deltaproteobacteria bacterium]